MAATETVAQRAPLRKPETESRQQSEQIRTSEPIIPRHGVVTLFGYGINVRVDRGHLILDDGIGPARLHGRFPRVGHGLERLVVIGNDGNVSLAALRWLADQNVAFVMLERDGRVLAATGPVRSSDAKLRRAQACADESGVALEIVRMLIHQKLAGQEQVARDRLGNTGAADQIAQCKAAVPGALTIPAVRDLESFGAAVYWAAWQNVPVTFPRKDLPRVPDHWRTFGTRTSMLSGSPRLAVNPPNAMLNYLYAILESEARISLAALGLDPGLGFMHLDRPNRDSLACDLMEAVRPQVDAFVFDWISSQPLKREWVFEQRDGTCRLMAPFASHLSETAATWRRAVAPFAEWIAHELWRVTPGSDTKRTRSTAPATPLTQRRRREAKNAPPVAVAKTPLKPAAACRICGVSIAPDRTYCSACRFTVTGEKLQDGAAEKGRTHSLSAEAQAKRAEKQRRNAAARNAWNESRQPPWLTEETFRSKIQPRLAKVPTPAIASAMGVSKTYATSIRRGNCCPHPRHWLKLAELVGVTT